MHDPHAMHDAIEAKALANLVTAAAVNKRLLMRILAHLEQKDLADMHAEVAALDAEFRATVTPELEAPGPIIAPAHPVDEAPLPEGDIPVGREEERRGHALPNEAEADTDRQGNTLGRDQHTRIKQAVNSLRDTR